MVTTERSGRVPASVAAVVDRLAQERPAVVTLADVERYVADTGTAAHRTDHTFDVVAVRFGVNRDTTAVKQLLGLKDRALAGRTSMAQIPLPFF